MNTLESRVTCVLADTITPVSVYLRIRDEFPGALLLESADYGSRASSVSYICFDPIAEIRVENEKIYRTELSGSIEVSEISERSDVLEALKAFLQSFSIKADSGFGDKSSKYTNGIFGYTSYDCIRYFEDIHIESEPLSAQAVPDLCYQLFRYVVAIDHFHNELFLVENSSGDLPQGKYSSEEIVYLLQQRNYATYDFSMVGSSSSNLSDQEYIDLVSHLKRHIARGDIFQAVPSRRFSQSFSGDDFQVYRALRSVNPSPFLFYFDYGSFKIFGSSPETQLLVKDGKASLFPIAGTCPRTGCEEADVKAVEALHEDPKENAEHVMLVDLARNDLGKGCEDVFVEEYKEIQYFSHVVHITSKVSGGLKESVSAVDLFADTFPMGTLSGAPKHRAMQLIEKYEPDARQIYGGAIGFFGFDGSCTHAIVIRTFLSLDNVLYRQAGAGVVDDSVPEHELEEVNYKLGALGKALTLAEGI